jgi:hypothetical protein
MVVSHITGSVELRQSQEAVETFVLFCEKQGIDSNMYDSAMKACVILSLICPDVQDMCNDLIPDVFIPWDSVSVQQLVFGINPTIWVHVMQFFQLDENVADEQVAIQSGCPMPAALCTFYQLLKQSSISLTYEHAARLFVLCNVSQLPMGAVLTQYNKKYNAATTSISANVFVGKYVDSRVKFERGPSHEAMLWVLRHLHVSSDFKQHVKYYNNHRSSTQNRRMVRTMQTQGGRLRLRTRLAELSLTHKSPVNVFNDTFASWCVRVRLPLSTRLFLKKKLYFLRAQNYDVTDAVYSLVSDDIAKLVMQTPVYDPDPDVIDLVISRLLLNAAPFKAMVDFSVHVFPPGSASAITVRSMPNPLLFQLYMAAYQPTHWRNHWSTIYPETGVNVNHIVINNVERYVNTHAICVASVMPYILAAHNNCDG